MFFSFSLIYLSKGENRHDAHVQTRGANQRGSIMYFGIISRLGKVCFIPVTGAVPKLEVFGRIKSVKAIHYESVLFEHLLPFLDQSGSRDAVVFQQDGAAIHTAGSLMSKASEEIQAKGIKQRIAGFFEREGINVAPWVSNSPDLNPIENIRGMIKWALSEMVIENLAELHAAVVTLFDQVCTVEMSAVLYDSMLRRLNAVIEAAGYRTKY